MRARRPLALTLTLSLAVGGCTSNPDPREPTIEFMQKQSFGGWIVVAERAGTVHAGELISTDSGVVRVLGPRGMSVIPMAGISSASLYKYEHEGGLGAWGLLGGLSTISHGFVLVLTFPIWMITTGFAAGFESSHILIEYPDEDWQAFAVWARFPQGMPPGLDARALTTPRSTRPPPVQPPAPATTPPPASAPPPPPPGPATTPPPTRPPPPQPWPPPAPPATPGR